MAFTDEQKKELTDIVSGVMKSFNPEPKPEEKPEPKPEEKDPSVIEQARKKQADADARNIDIADAEESAKFELNFKDFKEENASYMPEELEYILNVVNAGKFESKSTKVKETKAAIMDAFFAKEKNLEALNETQKAKAKKYNDLTREAKRENASQYWEVLEIAIDNLKLQSKIEVARKQNGLSGNDVTDKYTQAIFDRSARLMGVKK
jgi:hypothetical protein